ncbi:MAG: hypothetical protein KatS3mg068_0435 [Candidatus Sericytochromatia bacterium]|nr:MAG: hypothetical protein KatS3mg068_0435 [Candidatus Sericytochromatia bacterium]
MFLFLSNNLKISFPNKFINDGIFDINFNLLNLLPFTTNINSFNTNTEFNLFNITYKERIFNFQLFDILKPNGASFLQEHFVRNNGGIKGFEINYLLDEKTSFNILTGFSRGLFQFINPFRTNNDLLISTNLNYKINNKNDFLLSFIYKSPDYLNKNSIVSLSSGISSNLFENFFLKTEVFTNFDKFGFMTNLNYKYFFDSNKNESIDILLNNYVFQDNYYKFINSFNRVNKALASFNIKNTKVNVNFSSVNNNFANNNNFKITLKSYINEFFFPNVSFNFSEILDGKSYIARLGFGNKINTFLEPEFKFFINQTSTGILYNNTFSLNLIEDKNYSLRFINNNLINTFNNFNSNFSLRGNMNLDNLKFNLGLSYLISNSGINNYLTNGFGINLNFNYALSNYTSILGSIRSNYFNNNFQSNFSINYIYNFSDFISSLFNYSLSGLVYLDNNKNNFF